MLYLSRLSLSQQTYLGHVLLNLYRRFLSQQKFIGHVFYLSQTGAAFVKFSLSHIISEKGQGNGEKEEETYYLILGNLSNLEPIFKFPSRFYNPPPRLSNLAYQSARPLLDIVIRMITKPPSFVAVNQGLRQLLKLAKWVDCVHYKERGRDQRREF